MDQQIIKDEQIHSTPSKSTCESMIKRILMSEVLQSGRNTTFRKAADFMSFFESLYPASPALTKQVQRAVKALNMPRDEQGFFIAGKTMDQMDEESKIKRLLSEGESRLISLDKCEPVLLAVSSEIRAYLLSLIKSSQTFEGTYVTVIETSEGLLFYTTNKNRLEILVSSLIEG